MLSPDQRDVLIAELPTTLADLPASTLEQLVAGFAVFYKNAGREQLEKAAYTASQTCLDADRAFSNLYNSLKEISTVETVPGGILSAAGMLQVVRVSA